MKVGCRYFLTTAWWRSCWQERGMWLLSALLPYCRPSAAQLQPRILENFRVTDKTEPSDPKPERMEPLGNYISEAFSEGQEALLLVWLPTSITALGRSCRSWGVSSRSWVQGAQLGGSYKRTVGLPVQPWPRSRLGPLAAAVPPVFPGGGAPWSPVVRDCDVWSLQTAEWP